MELSDIDARIAQLKEQIALKEATQNKVKEAYHNPYSKYHYGYIYDAIMGDRSGLDREAAEDAAYQKLLMEQAQADKIRAEQAYNTAYENELNRKNAQEIADKSNTSNDVDKVARIQKELGFADAEVEMTKDNLDIKNPESVRNYRKAVLNRKYWAAQLPSDFGVDIKDYEYTEPTESSPKVIVNNTKKELRALLGLGKSNWTDSQKDRYNELFAKIPDDDPEKVDFEVKLANKGKTTNETERAEYNKLNNKVKSGKLLTSGEKKRYNLLKSKYSK